MSSPTQPGRHILAAPAWPYANGPRHIGHVSGFALPCDMFSRYQRMSGSRVLMVSGTDEHGTPIQVQADAEGVSARELADRYNRVIAEDLSALGMSYDLFTRTKADRTGTVGVDAGAPAATTGVPAQTAAPVTGDQPADHSERV